VTAPVRVRPATFPPVGFSMAPSVVCWAAWCGPCGRDGLSLLIGRSSWLDRAGWQACMAAANAHIVQHKEGRRV